MLEKKLVSIILWSTIEDYVGLWEVKWEIKSLGIDDEKKVTIIILHHLLSKEFVVFYKSIWGTEKLTLISLEESFSVLVENKYWEPPKLGQVCIKIGSTSKGDDYYNNDKAVDLL